MGYESRIYVVEKSSLSPDENGKRFAEVIAVFNGSKFGGLSEIFKKKTDCYIYADNGNTRIFKDKYGDELTEAPLYDVIAFLKKRSKTVNITGALNLCLAF